MVFLFIAFLGIIFLLCFPFRGQIVLFFDEKTKKSAITFNLYGKPIKPEKKEKYKQLISTLKTTKIYLFLQRHFFVKIKRPVLRIILSRIIVQISMQSLVPYRLNPAILYPVGYVFLETLSALIATKVVVERSARLYSQIKIDFLINLHLIFSILMQIITPKRRSKWK